MQFCMEYQETIIYRLYISIIPEYNACLGISIFWLCFGKKVDEAATRVTKGLGP